MEQIKIFIMGVTGHGKSSFINYLIGSKVAKTGVGKPVTQKLTEYQAKINGIDLVITDTKGLEAREAEYQAKDIREHLKKNNLNDSFDNRYHSIFYCLKPPRMLDFDVEFINAVFKDISQPINFIITNCDGLKSDIPDIREKQKKDIQLMRKRINDAFKHMKHEIYEVCSVDIEATYKDPTPIKAFGKERIIAGLFDQVWNDACYVMSNISVKKYFEAVDVLLGDTKATMRKTYYDNRSGAFKPSANTDALKKAVDTIPSFDMKLDFSTKVNSIANQLQDYKRFICSYYQLFETSIIDSMFDQIIEQCKKYIYDELDVEKLGIKASVKESLKSLRGRFIFSFRDKKAADELFENIENNIRKKLSKVKMQKELENKFKHINKAAKKEFKLN